MKDFIAPKRFVLKAIQRTEERLRAQLAAPDRKVELKVLEQLQEALSKTNQ